MSLYFDTSSVAALGLLDECRNDEGASMVTFDDAPGAGAGGGADASPESTTETDSTTQDTAPADAAAHAAHADEDDEDNDDPDLRDETYKDRPWKDDPAFKRALTRGRRAQRKFAAARPLLEKARAFGLNAEGLDQLVNNARRYQDAEPTLRRLARGEDVSRADSRQSDKHEVPQFDRKSVPFDESVPEGKWLVDFVERQHNAYHNVVGAIQALMGEVGRLTEERQTEHRTREVTDWKTEIARAGEQLPEDFNGLPLRQLFSDAVVGAFHQARVRRERINPRAVIQHYLKKYKATKTDPAAAAAAAAQQRMAEASKKRPSSGAFAGGSPTGARDLQNERVSDVNRRIGGKRYLGPR